MAPKMAMKAMKSRMQARMVMPNGKHKAKGKGKSEGMGKAKAKGKGQNKGDGDGSDDDFDIVGCFCEDEVLKAFLRRGLINHLPFEDMLAEFHWRLSAPSCPGCLLKHC
jgi:hypothetical protein